MSTVPHQPDQILVCGLGMVGQNCVLSLQEFGVMIHAIDRQPQIDWELPHIPQLLGTQIQGDCRDPETLKRAHVQGCRAILIVTSNEDVNIETALAARLLNPDLRLVVRSSKQSLNDLLEQSLGNYIAFEPTQLAAPAFAFAALGTKTIGFFELNQTLFEVKQGLITPGHRWLYRSNLNELNTRRRRLLSCFHEDQSSHSTPVTTAAGENLAPTLPGLNFYAWDPADVLQVHDIVTTIEVVERSTWQHYPGFTALNPQSPTQLKQPAWQQRWRSRLLAWREALQAFAEQQIGRLVIFCGLILLTSLVVGTALFRLFYPELSINDAFYTTVTLLLGDYGDVFNLPNLQPGVPHFLHTLGLGLTLIGTGFVAVLYALFTERLLTLRFQFFQRRPPMPGRDHVIVTGLGRVGCRVANLLQQFRQPVVGLARHQAQFALPATMPVFEGPLAKSLSKTNLATAKTVVAVTEGELENLEMALTAHATNPQIGLVIRTYRRRFRDTVARLFPYAQVLCASELSAEAFVAAAFGERVLSLFRWHGQTVLVTDYQIEAGDTLNGKLLAEVAYGYNVIPVYHERPGQLLPIGFPADDIRLHIGDRLVVLATIQGLEQIENGAMAPRHWQVEVYQVLNQDLSFDGAAALTRVTGCSLQAAKALLEHLPGHLPQSIYCHQAHRLVQQLRKLQIRAQVVPLKVNQPTESS